MEVTCAGIIHCYRRIALGVDKPEFVVICADAEVRPCLEEAFIHDAVERGLPLIAIDENRYKIPSPLKKHWATLRFLQRGETLTQAAYLIVLGYGPDEPIWHAVVLPVIANCHARGIVLSSEEIRRGTDNPSDLITWLNQHKDIFKRINERDQ